MTVALWVVLGIVATGGVIATSWWDRRRQGIPPHAKRVSVPHYPCGHPVRLWEWEDERGYLHRSYPAEHKCPGDVSEAGR